MKGSHADLAEVPDTKLRNSDKNFRRMDSDLSSEVSTASGATSTVSSTSSSVLSERAARAAQQLSMLMAPTRAVVAEEADPATPTSCSHDLPPLDPRMDAFVEEFKGLLPGGSES